MELLKAIILGIVQGLTEFLPVSSSGHLVLSRYFLKFGELTDLSFEIFVHLGSLIAVLIYFRRELFDLVKSLMFFKNPEYQADRKICFWLIIATFVTGVIGLSFKDIFESLFSNPLFAAIMISVTGIIVYISDKVKGANLISSELNLKKSAFIGLGQALAITPGISRSGSTITFALLTGLKRKQAATFSFILSVPAILGANLSELKTFINLDVSQLYIYLAGFFAAFISGYLVINWLMKLIVKAKLHYFSFYCWAVSLLSIVLILSGIFE